jgi:uncharacterized phiE125 gp8 family phage protein
MMTGELAEPIVTMAEAQAFARIETGDEEALIAGLIRSASALCEAFLGQVVIEREFSEQFSPSAEWQRLTIAPVRSIDSVSVAGTSLSTGSYSADIDANGCGWIRITDPAVAGLVSVSGSAGMAPTENSVPEPIRQGVLRLVAYLFTARDGDSEIPAAVTALWRPYRRMRVS